METVGCEMNLFEPLMNQTAVDGEMLQELPILEKIMHGPQIDFQIEGGVQNYIDLNNYTLEVKVKLTGSTSSDILTATTVWIGNLPLHSLFNSLRKKFREKVWTASSKLYS